MEFREKLKETSIGQYHGVLVQDPDLFTSWFKEIKILSKREEGNVYLAEVYGKLIVAKTNHRVECLLYEFLVGEQVNKLGKNFAQTLGLFILPNVLGIKPYEKYIPYLLLEYIQGDILEETIFDENILLEFYIQIICALQFAQEKIHFTHYDLHSENIIIKKTPTLLEYPLKRGTRKVKSSILVTIIDFGYSHVSLPHIPKGLSVCMKRDQLERGTVPSVFDPLIDFLRISSGGDFLFKYIEKTLGLPALRAKNAKPSVKIYNWAREFSANNNLDEEENLSGDFTEDEIVHQRSILIDKLKATRQQGFAIHPLQTLDDTFIYPKIVTPITREEFIKGMHKIMIKDVKNTKTLKEVFSQERLLLNTTNQDELFSNYKLYLTKQRKNNSLYSVLEFLDSLL